jgi:hypothetical protein
MYLMFYQSSFNQDIGTKVVTVNGIHLYSMGYIKCDRYECNVSYKHSI